MPPMRWIEYSDWQWRDLGEELSWARRSSPRLVLAEVVGVIEPACLQIGA